MDKRDQVKAAKATGLYPAAWFRGYTRFTEAKLEAVLLGVAELEAEETIEAAKRSTAQEEAVPQTSEGFPVLVQVLATKTITYKGRQKTFRRGTLFRGEVAWELWKHHRTLVAPKEG